MLYSSLGRTWRGKAEKETVMYVRACVIVVKLIFDDVLERDGERERVKERQRETLRDREGEGHTERESRRGREIEIEETERDRE